MTTSTIRRPRTSRRCADCQHSRRSHSATSTLTTYGNRYPCRFCRCPDFTLDAPGTHSEVALELDWGAGSDGLDLPARTTLAAFLADNAAIADDPEVAAVKSLAIGESCAIGGGAFALCTVTRMS